MNKPGLGQKLRYRFDNYMSRGPGALIVGLALCSLVLVGVAGLVIGLAGIAPEGGEAPGVGEGIWQSLMHALDSGAVGADTGWGMRLVMLLVTIGGIFVLSTLIGVLSNSLSEKLEDLGRGRSAVVESGHTVILGWSAKMTAVLDQLMIANQSRHRPLVVILANRDKKEMDQDIKERYGRDWNTRVVCRTGQSFLAADLAIANVAGARSVILMSPDGEADPDMATIRSLMALHPVKDARGNDLQVVAELANPRRLEPARSVAGRNTVFVLAGEAISRIAAQACRQQGLSVVYQELLDFDGDELYFCPAASLEGRTFHDCLLAFPQACVIGVVDAAGQARVNPPMDMVIGQGWQLVGLAADEDRFVPGPAPAGIAPHPGLAAQVAPAAPAPERTLILAFNDRVPTIIRELDAYVAKGSSLTLVRTSPVGADEVAALSVGLANMVVRQLEGDTTDRRFLETLDLATVDHLMIMSPAGEEGLEAAENRTVLSLIQLRELARIHGYGFSITSEILDLSDRALVEAMEVDDFIVSDQLVSQLMAQLAENPGLEPVFADLFDADGAEIYLKPVTDFVKPGVELSFRTVVEAAARRSCVAIGYRIAALGRDKAAAYGVVLNPDKSSGCVFQPDDRIIVIADN